MPKEFDIIKKGQEIVNQIQSGNLVVTAEARNINVTKSTWKDALGRIVREQYPLSDMIGKEVANFVKAKSTQFSKSNLPSVEDYVIKHLNSETRRRLLEISAHLIDYVEQARANGVIEDRNMTGKLKEYQEQNARLLEEKEKLQKEVQRLKELNECLHKDLDRFGARIGQAEPKKKH